MYQPEIKPLLFTVSHLHCPGAVPDVQAGDWKCWLQ